MLFKASPWSLKWQVGPFGAFASRTSIKFGELVENKINATSKKLRAKKTVLDEKKLQSYLDKTSDGKVQTLINKTARFDKDFRAFLDDYQRQNKNVPRIIDVSDYAKNFELLEKTPEEREKEALMIEEFARQEFDRRKAASEVVSNDLDKNGRNILNEYL